MIVLRRAILLFAVLVTVGLMGCSSSAPTQTAEDEDTVNTGYTEQEKSDVTDSTSSFSPSEQERTTANSLGDLLRGNTAGVQVSSTPRGVQINIRGINTIYGDTTPLYVLDGVPISPNPDGTVPVNPHNVKSITVLKDAGSTSMYGSRGANGVIVVETMD